MELPKGVFCVKANRKEYWYYQPGRNTPGAQLRRRIPGDPTDPAFWTWLEEVGADVGLDDGSIAAMVESYQSSPAWDILKPSTKRDYERYLTQIIERWGTDPVGMMTRSDVLGWRRELSDRPTTANHMVSVVSTLFKWAMNEEMADFNPAADVAPFKLNPEQAPPWPDEMEELVQQHARWEVRAVCLLARYTGQRTADIVQMTLRDFKNRTLKVIQEKTGKEMWIPRHPALEPLIDEARRRGSIALFPTKSKTPDRMADSWRSMYYRELDKVPELAPIKDASLSVHGMRAKATNELLEVGCTEAEVSSITGMSLVVVARYAVARNRGVLAERAVDKWVDGKSSEH